MFHLTPCVYVTPLHFGHFESQPPPPPPCTFTHAKTVENMAGMYDFTP